MNRSTLQSHSPRPAQADLDRRIREICETRARYGCRRVHVLLRREGWTLNHKKTHRIDTELGLQLRNKTPKRRVRATLREERQEAAAANETGAMDFVHDQLATGRKLRMLTIVDTFSRSSPALDVRFSYRAEDVVETLDRVCAATGYLRAYQRGVILDFSPPGKPTDNAFIEAFKGRFRSECLDT